MQHAVEYSINVDTLSHVWDRERYFYVKIGIWPCKCYTRHICHAL